MFRASIALVVVAFASLIYGWVQGIDALLYGSIASSALAGIALLRSTLVERKKMAEAARARAELRGRSVDSTLLEPGGSRFPAQKAGSTPAGAPPARKSLAELQEEATRAAGPGEEFLQRRRQRINPFGNVPAEQPQDEFGPGVVGDDLLERTLSWVDASFEQEQEPAPPAKKRSLRKPAGPRRKPAVAQEENFAARLASLLGEDSPQSADEQPGLPPPTSASEADPEIGTDWIRIDDVPAISRATQSGGGYARPEVPAVKPPRRRAPAGDAEAGPAASGKSSARPSAQTKSSTKPATGSAAQTKTAAGGSRAKPASGVSRAKPTPRPAASKAPSRQASRAAASPKPAPPGESGDQDGPPEGPFPAGP